jgi:hypothetical protein
VKRKKTQKPKSNPKIGLPPGASVYIGKERDGAVEIDLISYAIILLCKKSKR